MKTGRYGLLCLLASACFPVVPLDPGEPRGVGGGDEGGVGAGDEGGGDEGGGDEGGDEGGTDEGGGDEGGSDEGGGDDGGWTDASGKAIATIAWRHLTEGGRVTPSSLRLEGEAHLFEPASVRPYHFWTDGIGTCEREGDSPEAVEGPAAIQLEVDGAKDLSLKPTGTGDYWGELEVTGAAAGEGSTLSTTIEAKVWPELVVEGAGPAPAPFESMSPDLIWTGWGGFWGEPFELSWSGSTGDLVLIEVADLNSDAVLRCVERDDGSFEFSRDDLEDFEWDGITDWEQTAEVWLTITTYTQDTSVQDFNGGEVRLLLGYGVAGRVELHDYD